MLGLQNNMQSALQGGRCVRVLLAAGSTACCSTARTGLTRCLSASRTGLGGLQAPTAQQNAAQGRYGGAAFGGGGMPQARTCVRGVTLLLSGQVLAPGWGRRADPREAPSAGIVSALLAVASGTCRASRKALRN